MYIILLPIGYATENYHTWFITFAKSFSKQDAEAYVKKHSGEMIRM